MGNVHAFNLHLCLCFSGENWVWGTRVASRQFCWAPWELRCACDGLAHLDRAGCPPRNHCFVTAPRRGESIQATIWAKTPSCPSNGHEFKPFSFLTIPQSPCCLLSETPLPAVRCMYFSGDPTATQTHLHCSACMTMTCLPLSFP